MVSGYVGYVHPCGAVSVGAIPGRKEAAEDKRNKSVHRRILARKNNPIEGTEAIDGIARQLQAREKTVSQAVDEYFHVGLSSLQNSRNTQTTSNQLDDLNPNHPACVNPKRVYGQNGISRMGRLRVKDGAAMLEKRYGKRALAFVTITLPNLPDAAMEKVCKNLGKYNHRVIEEIKRELVRHNVLPEIVHCVEIQEKRYLKTGKIAPHLHVLFPAYSRDENGNSTGRYAVSADRLRDINYRVLRRIIGDEDINIKASVDIQKVKKSAANYLGKYMSKGGAVVEKIKKDGGKDLLPHQWWGITKDLRDIVLRSIIKVVEDKARNLFFNINKLAKMGVIKKYCPVSQNRTYFDAKRNETVNQDVTYGLYGQLNSKLNHQNRLIASVLDICGIIEDDCIDDIRDWISALNSPEMVDDICDILESMKDSLLEENPTNVLIDDETGEIIKIEMGEKIKDSKVFHKSLFTDNSIDKVLETMY